MPDETETKCNRRAFLTGAVRATAACAVGGALTTAAGCASVPRTDATLRSNRILAVDLDAFDDAPGLLVYHPTLDDPIYLHRERHGGDGYRYSAVLTTCTHRGCRSEPTGDRIVCPCHGSQFSPRGRLLDGPADEPLVAFRTDIDDETLLIRLDDEV